MLARPHPRPGAWLLLAALGAGCAVAPPLPEPKDAASPVARPCPIMQAAACDTPGECKDVEVIGTLCQRVVLPGDSLIEMARQYDLGFNEIETANPGQDAFVPTPGAMVVIPTSWILPRTRKPGT